jgi:hypothetical protein
MKRSVFTFWAFMSISLIVNLSSFGQKVYKPTVNKSATYTVCQGIFTDSGDTTGMYGDSETDTIVFTPSTIGAKLTMNFRKFIVNAFDDNLAIYDGANTLATKIGDYSGDLAPGKITATNKTGALTFVFSSFATADGWVADMACSGGGLSCTTISAPSNGASNVSTNPHIGWQAASGATSYDFIYGYYVGHTPVIAGTFNTVNTSVDTFHLVAGTTYLWKIVPRNGTDTASGCSINTFTTLALPNCASKPSPADGATGVSSYSLGWASVLGATSYKVYYGTTSDLSGVKPITVQASPYTASLSTSTKYYWKVVAVNGSGDATGCSIWSFTTAAPAADLTITSPNGGETFTAGDVVTVTYHSNITNNYIYFQLSSDGGATWPATSSYLTYQYVYGAGDYITNITIPSSFQGSGNCKLRVYTYYFVNTDISDGVFTINTLPSTIKITTPTTNTLWKPGTYQYIYWTNSNIAANYQKVYYSLNNGASWNYIGQQYSSYGYINWYIPASITGLYSNSLISVSNADSSVHAVSSLFTISDVSPFTFVKPAKGDTASYGSYYNVTFSNNSNSTPSVYLYYSVDGGNSFIYSTASNTTTGKNQLNWYPPYLDSIATNCQLKLIDLTNSTNAYSAKFIITPQKGISIISPSYDYLAWGQPFPIKWKSFLIGSVNIDYSTDGGSSWNNIASNIASKNGANSYNFNAPAGTGLNYNGRIRISDASNSNTTATNYFYLQNKSITLNSPVGGEIYKAGDTIAISYTTATNLGYISFQVSFDGGATWTSIVGSQYSYYAGNYSFSYIVPLMTPGSANCKVKAYYYYPNSTAYSDVSAGTFTINSAPATIIVTAPTSGDFVKSLGYKYIYWESYKVKSVNIFYSTDNGVNWSSIASGISTSDSYNNYYYWTVPAISGYNDKSRIKIVSAVDNSVKGIGNNFILTDQSPVLITKPVKGAKWYAGSNGTIEFNNRSSQSFYTYAYISTDNINFTYIGTTYVYGNGTGTITWSIPLTQAGGKTYTVKLYDNNTSSYSVPSEAFEIVAAPAQITVSSPVKGTYIKTNSSATLSWTSLSAGSTVKIEYSINGGSSWNIITSSASTSNGYISYYYWTVPSLTGILNNSIIKITSNSNDTIIGTSDIFTISDKDQIQITYPVSPANITAGSDVAIRFVNNGLSQNSYFYVFYSTNGGSSWNYNSNTSFYGMPSGEGSFTWTVPSSLLDNSNVKLAISNSSYYPTSGTLYGISGAFSVTGLPPVIKVKAPLAGDYFNSGTYRYITWNSLHSSTVKIEYSTDGSSWNTITSSYGTSDGDNSYYWYVPFINAGTSINSTVKVTDSNKPAVGDTSETFTISKKSPLSIISPNGGETLQAGGSTLISFNNAGQRLNSYVNLYYTLNDGSWISIGSIYTVPSGLSTYTWNVPGNLTDSNRYKIIIYESSYYTSDTSNAFFTIKGATPSIKVSSPAYGSVLWSNDYSYVYFNTINVKNANLDYSLDGGATWTNAFSNQAVSGDGNFYWHVPSVLGIKDNCVVKVSSSKDKTVYGLSGIFTIKDGTVHYTITSPNGSEILKAGTYNTISFNNTGKSSYASLSYSVNDGTTWNNITSLYTNYGNNPYSWYIPETTSKSKTCKVRVIDYYSNAIGDTSDADFTITAATPYITVSAPSGGSWWISGKGYSVSWNSLNVVKAIIEISTDGGSTYSSLDTVDAINGNNTFSVTAPSVTSTSYTAIVRVKSANSFKINSTSAYFNISKSAPALAVLSPNGGEEFTAGNYMPVAFNNEGPATYVYIKLSTDSGATWTSLNNGFYAYTGKNSTSWYIPYYSKGTSKALVRIEPYSGSIHVAGQSSSVFTIKAISPFITLSAPVAYNLWWSDESHNINWNSAHVVSASLFYSIDSMKTWNKISEHLSTIDGSNSYNWAVPEIEGKAANSYIKIINDDDNTVSGLSKAFTIDNEATIIKVIKPNGAELYNAGDYINISYTYSGRLRDYVTLYLSTDNGKTKNSIGKDYSVSNGTHSYSYYIPTDAASTRQCLIYVEEGFWNKPAIDKSDTTFTIRALPPSIKNVNSSESYIVSGNIYSLSWTGFKSVKVNIDYSTDNGKTWVSLATNIASTDGSNSYSFIGPAVTGTFANSLFKVTSANSKTITSTGSTVTISNVPLGYTLVSPNGGEKLQAGKTYTISFSKNGPASYDQVQISLSTDGGANYDRIGYSSFNNNSKGDYSWTIDKSAASKYCKIQVSGYNKNGLSDTSDSLFEILAAPAQIMITSPAASSYWIDSTLQSVVWNSESVSKVNIDYSLDAGTTWTNLASNILSSNGNNSWSIEVPATDSTSLNAKVRVVSASDTSVRDVSQSFIMSPSAASITILKPFGGNVLKSGTTYFVEYKYVGPPVYGAYIDYSSNGGNNWNYIAYIGSITEGTHSFEWSLPADIAISNYYKILIATSNGSFSTISDGLFSVIQGKSEISVTTPNNNSYLLTGASQSIIWKSQNIDVVNIEYSLDAGSTWNTIVSNDTIVNGSNSYNWTIPSITGTYDNAHIRITSVADSKLSTLSEGFVISDVARSIAIIDPNGGNTLNAGKYYNVKFVNNGPKIKVGISVYNSENTTGYWLGYYDNVQPGKNIIEVKIPEALNGNDSSLLKIEDYNNSNYFDYSDTAFTIIGINPIISNVSPDSTAYWSAGDDRSISWKGYNIDTVIIAYTIDAGKTWHSIDTVATINGLNYYSWKVVDIKVAKSAAQIKIYSKPDSKVSGLSGKFTLTGNPVVITLNRPNGGETVKAGASDTLKYKYTANDKQVNAYISYDNGSAWNKLCSGNARLGNNSIAFTLPIETTPSTLCLVRIEDEDGVADTSNAVFTVAEADPTISVESPDTGNYWISKSIHSITWFSWKVKKVNLEYSKDNGKTWLKIRSNIPTANGDNKFNWSIPVVSGTFDTRLRVISAADSKVLGVSKTFTLTDVQASITITNPKKGDTKQAGVQDSVKFAYVGPATSVAVYFSADSGATWKLLADNNSIMEGNAVVGIKIPIATPVSTGGQIKISDTTGLTGVSDLFTIKAAPATIIVSSPSAKAYLISGNKTSIAWESYSVDSVKIDYSLDNGKTWSIISNKVIAANGTNSYNWDVANVTNIMKASLIRVTNAANNKVSDTSAVFTINNKYPSTDARLTEIDINGIAISKFDAETTSYDFTVPFSVVNAPKVTAKTSSANASFVVNNATHLNGTTSITVTAEDAVTMRVYNVNFTKNKVSSNASLADLKISGKTVTGFKANTYLYKVTLAAGTTIAPVVSAIVADTTAKVTVKTTTTLPWISTISVTAEDGKTKATYEIDFTVPVDVVVVAARTIRIYPNPVTDNLTVTNAENAKIFIYNLNGQMVKAINTTDKATSIDFSSYEPGSYILKIVKGEIVTESKVIKMK